MSRTTTAGLLALALSAVLAAGAALWLGTRPMAPPAPLSVQPEMEAALAQLQRIQAGEADALPELRARLEAIAEAQERAGNPLRLEAVLQGLAGRIEGTLSTLEGNPAAPSQPEVVSLAALGVGALGLVGLLLAQRRKPVVMPGNEPPAWAEGLRADTLTLARQAQEGATRATDQQEALAQRIRLVAERLDAMPIPDASQVEAPRLLDRLETLMAGLSHVTTRTEIVEDRHARSLERMEDAVAAMSRSLENVPQEEAMLDRMMALLPALESAAADARATAPQLGELAALAKQAMNRVTDEAVVRIGAAAERTAQAAEPPPHLAFGGAPPRAAGRARSRQPAG